MSHKGDLDGSPEKQEDQIIQLPWVQVHLIFLSGQG